MPNLAERREKLARQKINNTKTFELGWAKGKNVIKCPSCDSDVSLPQRKIFVNSPVGIIGWVCASCGSRFNNDNDMLQLRYTDVPMHNVGIASI